MTLFIISIPLMLVAVGIAVVPLIAMSRSEMRDIAVEVERYVAHQRLAHQAHRHHTQDEHRAGTPAHAPATRTPGLPSRTPVLVGES